MRKMVGAYIVIPYRRGYKGIKSAALGDQTMLGSTLQRYFRDIEDVKEILECGDILSLFDEGHREHFEKLCAERQADVPCDYIRLTNGIYAGVPKSRKLGTEKTTYFKDIGLMEHKGAKYVYIFQDGRWKSYLLEDE